MTNTITVSLTDTQKKEMEYLVVNPQDFLDNFAHETSRKGGDEIVALTVTHCLDNGIQVPATREAIVAYAFDNDVVNTAANRQAEAEAQETP
jgi:hypothetical protein